MSCDNRPLIYLADYGGGYVVTSSIPRSFVDITDDCPTDVPYVCSPGGGDTLGIQSLEHVYDDLNLLDGVQHRTWEASEQAITYAKWPPYDATGDALRDVAVNQGNDGSAWISLVAATKWDRYARASFSSSLYRDHSPGSNYVLIYGSLDNQPPWVGTCWRTCGATTYDYDYIGWTFFENDDCPPYWGYYRFYVTRSPTELGCLTCSSSAGWYTNGGPSKTGDDRPRPRGMYRIWCKTSSASEQISIGMNGIEMIVGGAVPAGLTGGEAEAYSIPIYDPIGGQKIVLRATLAEGETTATLSDINWKFLPDYYND